MPDFFRVPIHPEDAAQYRAAHDTALQDLEDAERTRFQMESNRLADIAAYKRHADRMQGSGPVDQETSLRWANKMAPSPLQDLSDANVALRKFGAWSTSKPDTRNVFVQALMAPEHMVMHTAGAMRTPGGLGRESLSRLAAAPVASFFPDMGYPLEPERDALYSRLHPAAAFVVDAAVMPGPDEAGNAIRALTRAARQSAP